MDRTFRNGTSRCPVRKTAPVNLGWIWTANLRSCVEVLGREVGFSVDDDDWLAIECGIAGTDSEDGPWFDYPVGRLTVFVAYEPGAAEMVAVRVEGIDTSIGEMKAHWLGDLLRDYRVARPDGR